MIPKKIHYCWFGENEKPLLVIECIKSWQKYCPDYEIMEWNSKNYDVHKNKYMEQAYQAKRWGFVSDYARLDIIYQYGGIYFDTDVELIRSLDDLLETDGYIGFEKKVDEECDEVYVNTGQGFGASVFHPVVKAMMDIYKEIDFVEQEKENLKTCPYYNTAALVKLGMKKENVEQEICKFHIYPAEYFCPINWKSHKCELTDNTYSIHHFEASWLTEKEKKKRKYLRNMDCMIHLPNRICRSILGKERYESIKEKITADVKFEIIIVDNASKNKEAERLQAEFENSVKMIEAETNLGFGKANNLGTKYAAGDYVFFLNPDTVLMNNAVKILWEEMKNNPDMGCTGGNLYTPERMPCPSFCLRFDDLGTEKRYASWRYLMLSKAEQKLYRKHPALQIRRKDFNDTNQKIEVAYIFGADMLVKKKLFEQLGGFDEDFFMYAEEEELSWRIKKRGEKIYNIPQAKIIHLEGATLEKQHDFNEKQFTLRINGTMTYFWKRYGREGIYQFYKFRALRYQRLKKIAEIQKKSDVSFQLETRLRCLLECFEKIMEKTEGEGKKNGRS